MTAVIEASRIVRWRHRRGGEAHCLARLVRSPTGRYVAVLTELSSNPEGSGVAGDAAAAADAFIGSLRRQRTAIPPESITWVLQHGAYSYPESVQEPETFTAIALTWAADRFTEDRSGAALLTADQQRELFGDTLPPVEQDVAGAAAEQP